MSETFFTVELGTERRRLEVPRQGDAEIVVGRAPECAIVVSAAAVSRRHARLRWREDDLVLEDLGSANGTFVNGVRLAGPRALRDGDRVSLGAIAMVLSRPAPPPEPTSDATISLPPETDWQATMMGPGRATASSSAVEASRAPTATPVTSATPTRLEPPAAEITAARAREAPLPKETPAPPPAAQIQEPSPAASPVARIVSLQSPLVTPGAGAGALFELAGVFLGAALGVFAVGALILRFFF
jgi:predicted component of type VI protein secretion system